MPKRVVAQRRKPRVVVKRNCRFCENKNDFVDFKDHDLLRRFQTEKGKIMPRRISGNCMRHQKMIAIAIKNARVMSLAL